MHYLFIIALSSGNRNTLGFSFPGWGFGVTEPISIKPKPISVSPVTASACLSNPAAIPIGFGNVRPNNCIFYRNSD